jgi:GTPase SAR1 family protein
MIVGEGRAGKTALANSILGRDYQPTDSTIGINNFTCSIGSARTNGKGGKWSEYADLKNKKQFEMEIAKLVSADKNKMKFAHYVLKPNLTIKQAQVEYVGEVLRVYEHELPELNENPQCFKIASDTTGKGSKKENRLRLQSSFIVDSTTDNKKDNTTERNGFFSGLKSILWGNQDEELSMKKDLISTYETEFHSSEEIATIDSAQPLMNSQNRILGNIERMPFDNKAVIEFLGDTECCESKFILSIFDFGGQNVFNVIHPLFLTRLGVYLLVFNMQWLLDDGPVGDSCLRNLAFWLNSISIHTFNERNGDITPIFIIGTRKDLVTSPEDHVRISTLIHNVLSSNGAWPYVMENTRTEGPNGLIDLCFFPVDNTMGNQDPTLGKLYQQIEKVIDGSDYVHVERRLNWFGVLDALKAQRLPYLSLSKVREIVISCHVPEENLESVLKFFHEMGIIMWFDQDEILKEVIVFDPIEYFVKPSTVLICKHVPDMSDGIHHVLEIHREARKTYPRDFSEMTGRGLVSERLMTALLRPYSQNLIYVKQLMLNYGLIVPLQLSSYGIGDSVVNDSATELVYLAPALLPEKTIHHNPMEEIHSAQFHFLFSASTEFNGSTNISLEDCRKHGFLPRGLFEKLLSKLILWSVTTSNFVEFCHS